MARARIGRRVMLGRKASPWYASTTTGYTELAASGTVKAGAVLADEGIPGAAVLVSALRSALKARKEVQTRAVSEQLSGADEDAGETASNNRIDMASASWRISIKPTTKERRLEEVKKINDSDLYQKRERIELMRKIWGVGEEEDEERSSDAIGVAGKGQRRVSYMEENNVDGVHEKAKRRRRGTCSVSGIKKDNNAPDLLLYSSFDINGVSSMVKQMMGNPLHAPRKLLTNKDEDSRRQENPKEKSIGVRRMISLVDDRPTPASDALNSTSLPAVPSPGPSPAPSHVIFPVEHRGCGDGGNQYGVAAIAIMPPNLCIQKTLDGLSNVISDNREDYCKSRGWSLGYEACTVVGGLHDFFSFLWSRDDAFSLAPQWFYCCGINVPFRASGAHRRRDLDIQGGHEILNELLAL
uniref:Uncharacterized protein n=1 Tax=Musa balbisiana TaxID=52838 RepID=Q1EP40_MUSBA|nr:hypothetical protein MBP_91N22.24 [Musa balbisiana]